jgi:hypothetical protein
MKLNYFETFGNSSVGAHEKALLKANEGVGWILAIS